LATAPVRRQGNAVPAGWGVYGFAHVILAALG
jgi:hypothetical protein